MATLLYNGKQSSAVMNFVHEDPDTTKKRIFIEHMGMDVETLNPRFGEFFSNQNTVGQTAPASGSRDDINRPIMQTVNGLYAWGLLHTARRDNLSHPGLTDPWIASLDYNNLPGKELLKTSTGLVILSQHHDVSTTNIQSTLWIGTDLAGTPTFQQANNPRMAVYFYEDPLRPNEFFCIDYDTTQIIVGKMIFTAGAAPTLSSVRVQSSANTFFVGRNTDGSATFHEVNGTTQSSQFYKIPSVGSAVLMGRYDVNSPEGNYHYAWPSNVRYDSPTRRVYYQGTWEQNVGITGDQYKSAVFHRFIYDPTTGNVQGSPCTLVFPNNTRYTDYHTSALFTTANAAWNLNNWYYKCHQFTINGVSYLTFYFIHKAQPNFFNELTASYRREKQDRWITFTIGSGENDNVLTYHSTWEFSGSARGFPRYTAPIDPSGTQLLYIKHETVSTLSFDIVKGWFEHDNTDLCVRSFCVDSVGRIYLSTTGPGTYYDTSSAIYDHNNGYGPTRIWLYEPSKPTTITVEPSSTNYIYQGTNISSTLLVDARDYTGTRVALSVKLTISGGNVTFSDGSVQTTVLTESSTVTSVGILIKGGGKPVISASAA